MSTPRPAPHISSTIGSIDQVLDDLSRIIALAKAENSRLGYFAALYRKVTLQVREGIHNGLFDNAERMERFDVIFARRYIDAFNAYRDGRRASRVWECAFSAAEDYWPIVLQHLLLGMNAHINLDLGLAAAEVMKGQNLADLRGDFNRINGILSSLVDDVQNDLGRIWKTLRLFNRLLGNVEDELINFSMKHARDEAWRSAEAFSTLADADRPAAIAKQDDRAMVIATLVRHPGTILGTATAIVRVGEVRSVSRVIGILS